MLEFSLTKKIAVLLVILLGVLYALPNFMPASYVQYLPHNANSVLPGKTINLGLDLQGGAHLLLAIDEDNLVKEQYELLQSEVRTILREQKLGYKNLKASLDNVSLVPRRANEQEAIMQALSTLGNVADINSDNKYITITYNQTYWDRAYNDALQQTIKVIRKRIDALGTTEPIIQPQGNTRIIVQAPGEDDPEALKRTLGKTAKMTFHLVHKDYAPSGASPNKAPRDAIILPDHNDENIQYVVEKKVRVSGAHLADASSSFQDNEPVVSFRFDTKGARAFGATTTEFTGRYLAIILDGEVISAPVIREPILGGNGVISGAFAIEEANELAILLKAGALPQPLIILEERSVGPGLGADSINAGKIASIIALIAVMVFMVIAYRRFGVYANIALAANLVLIVAILSFLQATLTLPGIAGIVLTIGMAVDANVLIFERIREEYDNGKVVKAAIESGFKRAFSTIIDSNITTLLGTSLLFAFGSGPVKGFAVTLSIGIICSMFTALLLTRFFIAYWAIRNKPKTLKIRYI